MSDRKKCYLAAGWFNPTQAAELDRLEQILDERDSWVELASPRRIFVCPPNAPKDVQDAISQLGYDAEKPDPYFA